MAWQDSFGQPEDGLASQESPDVNYCEHKEREQRPFDASRFHKIIGENEWPGDIQEESHVPNTKGPFLSAIHVVPIADKTQEKDVLEKCRRAWNVGAQSPSFKSNDGQKCKDQNGQEPCAEWLHTAPLRFSFSTGPTVYTPCRCPPLGFLRTSRQSSMVDLDTCLHHPALQCPCMKLLRPPGSVIGGITRVDIDGTACHALNRGNFRSRLFKKELERYLTPFLQTERCA